MGKNTKRMRGGGGEEEDLSSIIINEDIPKVVYICSFLDYNIQEWLKTKNQNTIVWININAYNVGQQGGTPWDDYKLIVEKQLGTIEYLERKNIHLVNPNAVSLDYEVNQFNQKWGANKVDFNLFGLKKMAEALIDKKFAVVSGCKNSTIVKKELKFNNYKFNYLDAIATENAIATVNANVYVNLYNEILAKLDEPDITIEKWNTFITEKKLYDELIPKFEQFITNDLTKNGGQYLKITGSYKVGPQLSNDLLGMVVGSYITTNTQYTADVANPVLLNGKNPQIINSETVAFDKIKAFNEYFKKNSSEILSNSKNLPDYVIHDGEEDDIAAIQYLQTYKNHAFTCIMQLVKNTNTDVIKHQMNEIYPDTRFILAKKQENEIYDKLPNIDKVKAALLKCSDAVNSSSKNCFEAEKEVVAEEAVAEEAVAEEADKAVKAAFLAQKRKDLVTRQELHERQREPRGYKGGKSRKRKMRKIKSQKRKRPLKKRTIKKRKNKKYSKRKN